MDQTKNETEPPESLVELKDYIEFAANGNIHKVDVECDIIDSSSRPFLRVYIDMRRESGLGGLLRDLYGREGEDNNLWVSSVNMADNTILVCGHPDGSYTRL